MLLKCNGVLSCLDVSDKAGILFQLHFIDDNCILLSITMY